MNRIIKGRFHIASRGMAIGSAASAYTTNALRQLKFVGRGLVAKDSSGRKRANASTRFRGRRKARHILTTNYLLNSFQKSPHRTSKQRRHDGLAADYAVDSDGDVNMDMGIDTDTDNSSILSTPQSSFSHVPSTPRSSFYQTPSTPHSSGSSFSQTIFDTPCPVNNAFVPLPDFSDEMEGVVFTTARPTTRSTQPAAPRIPPRPMSSSNQPAAPRIPPRPMARSNQPAAPGAPPKNGVVAFNMQPATVQQQAPSQIAPQKKPAHAAAPSQAPVRNGVMSFTMNAATPQPPAAPQPAFQPALSQPPQPAPHQGTTGGAVVAQATPITVTKDFGASAPIWVRNDPAKVFKAPTWPWPVKVAPLWASIRALPQLLPGTQLRGINNPVIPAASQPPTSDVSKQILTAAPALARPVGDHQPKASPKSTGTGIAQQTSIDNSMQAVVGLLALLHVSEPNTWAWTEPNVFGPFIGKDKSKGFNLQLATAANVPLPGDDIDLLDNEADTQMATVPQSMSTLPTTDANAPSSVAPEAVVQEQPAQAVTLQANPSVPQYIGQTPATAPAAPQAATATGVPTKNGSLDQATGTEGSQSTDKGKGIAALEQFNLNDIKLKLDNARQLMGKLQINNPFANAPNSPASTAPTSVQLFGRQFPMSVAPTANGAAAQEKPYEVGGDEDPNVDPEFDFKKYFRRTAPAAAASTPSTPDVSTFSSSAEPPVETSSPVAASTTTEAIPPTEASSPTETSSPAEAILSAEASSPIQDLSIAASTPAEASPPVEASPPEPRGTKRMRDIDSDRYLPPSKTHLSYGPGPITEWDVQAQSERRVRRLVAEFKDEPIGLYDEEYALEMMENMFYETLPRLASEVMNPAPLYTVANQEDEAKYLVDMMLEEELNETGFKMVQQRYEYDDELNFTFPISHWAIFDLFCTWFESIAVELPGLDKKMTKNKIEALGEVFMEEIYNYMDAHPPEEYY